MSSIQQRLPLGCQFYPKDGELLVFYLKEKLKNETNVPHYVNYIKEVKVYNHSPQVLTEINLPLGEKTWYFYTERNRMHENGGRPSRCTKDDSGYWKSTSGEKDVIYNNEIVGTKQVLVFYEGKHSKAKKTTWIMHEYMVKRSDEVKFDNVALCRIYKRKVKPPRNADRVEIVRAINNKENSLEGVSHNNDDLTNWIEDNVPPSDSIRALMQTFAPEYLNHFSHVPNGEEHCRPVSHAQDFPVENVSRSGNEDLEQGDLDFSKQLEDMISHVPYGGEDCRPVSDAQVFPVEENISRSSNEDFDQMDLDFSKQLEDFISHVPYGGEDCPPVSDAQVVPVEENVSRSSNEDSEQMDLDFSKQLEEIISLEDGSEF